MRFQESRCDRLEEEIAADRDLAKLFVAYANLKYYSLRLKLKNSRKLAEDYCKELESKRNYCQEIADLRSSLLQTTAAWYKDQEKLQSQLAAIEKKQAEVITLKQVAEDRAPKRLFPRRGTRIVTRRQSKSYKSPDARVNNSN